MFAQFPEVPPGIANLTQLEMLNLFNNHIEELPVSLSSMPKLRILNVGSVHVMFYILIVNHIIEIVYKYSE